MKRLMIILCLAATGQIAAQTVSKQSLLQKKYSLHWQTTFIPQYHFNFHAPYSGEKSLQSSEPA
ncbi:MAG: hypothetical protein AAB212_02170, partial [Bacteroidota bacterium]